MSHVNQQMILTSTIVIIFMTIVMTIFIDYKNDCHYIDIMNGFWSSDQLLIHIDAEHKTFRIMELNLEGDIVSNDKIIVEVEKNSMLPCLDLTKRTFNIKPSGNHKPNTKLCKHILQGGVKIEIFGTEGIMILSDSEEDLITLSMDVNANLEML